MELRHFVDTVVEATAVPIQIIPRGEKRGMNTMMNVLFEGCSQTIEFQVIGETIRFKFANLWHDLSMPNNDYLLKQVVKTLKNKNV